MDTNEENVRTRSGQAIAERKKAEEALKESEERFSKVFFGNQQAMAISELDGKLIEVNTKFEQLFGVERQKLLGHFMSDFLEYGDRSKRERTLKLLNEGKEVEDDQTYFLKTGRKIDAIYFVQVINVNGKKRLFGMWQDITERKKAEDSLKQSEEKYRNIVETTQEGILVTDLEGKITFANAHIADSLGYTVEELVGKPGLALAVETEKDTAQERMRKRQKGIKEQYEIWMHRKDGGKVCFLANGSPIKSNQGLHIGNLGMYVDITERKKAEEALRENKAKLQAAFASMTEAIFIADAEGNIVDFNDEFVRYHRFKDKDECSRNIADCPKYLDVWLVDGTPAPVEQWAMARALRGEIGSNVEYRLRRKETGEMWWGSYNFSPIKDQGGKIVGAVVACRDITKQKKAEESLNKLNQELEERVRNRTEQVSNERQRLYKVLETLPVYVILLDKDYCVPFANKVFRKRFGEGHGRRCYDFLFKRESPCENCETYKVLKTNGPHRWEWTGPDDRDYDVYDFPFVDADGSTLILEMGIDITERNRSEKQARDVSLCSRSLIEASLDPLVTISIEGKITDVNQATEIATGCSKEELIGSDFSDYFTDPEKAKIGYKQVFSEGFVRDYPLAIRHKSGKVTDVLYNAAIYTNSDGEMQGVFAAA